MTLMALRLHTSSLHDPFIAPTHSLKSLPLRNMPIRSHAIGTNHSRKLVMEVKEKLEKDHYNLLVGRHGRDDEDMILWFLKDRKFNIKESIYKLTRVIQWRKGFGVSELSETSVRNTAETGKSYVQDFLNVHSRPVLIVDASKHFPWMLDPSEDEKLCVFLIEKAISKLPDGMERNIYLE
ncbi:hypothetical protein LguiA_018017 [Lonicera macranthoides]